jgi:uncharacterized protein YjbI with pentapeptide repeats
MSRLGASIAALTLSLLAMSGQAQASIEDKDVAKLTSFGGMCANCDLAGRKLMNAKFTGANFAKAILIGADLRGAMFYGSNFQSSDLSRADLRGAEMRGANFTGANFTDARMSGIESSGANFTQATLLRVDLSSAELHAAQMNGANRRPVRGAQPDPGSGQRGLRRRRHPPARSSDAPRPVAEPSG